MGGADLVVVGASGVCVVVVGVGTGLLDGGGLLVVHEAQTDADLDVGMVCLKGAHHAVDALDISPGGAMPRGHHADATGPAGDTSLDGLVHLLGVGPGVLHDLGTRPQALRAV